MYGVEDVCSTEKTFVIRRMLLCFGYDFCNTSNNKKLYNGEDVFTTGETFVLRGTLVYYREDFCITEKTFLLRRRRV